MLGDDKFSDGLRYFVSNWKGKHPSPYDFFNSINTRCGTNLNWFWNDWFFSKISPDLAIKNVRKRGNSYTVSIQKKGAGMVPVHLTFFYKNGTQQSFSRNISCWAEGNDVYAMKICSKAPVKKITLGNDFDADIDSSNNVWVPGRD
jgi:aminopeptidase N